MRAKLAFLSSLLILVLCVGVYAAIQCIPEPGPPEELYEYDTLVPPTISVPIETTDPDLSAPCDASTSDLCEPEPPEEPTTPSIDFAALKAQNKHFTGWLIIDGPNISLPVVQGPDNSYYLKHSFTRAYSSYGCPFLDTRTPLSGDCLVIHGHNMGYNRTEIFSTLVYYQDPVYAKEHAVIQFLCPDGQGGIYDLYAVTNVNLKDTSMSYVQSIFETAEERAAFLSKFKTNSCYVSDTVPSEGQILILSTCNRKYGADNRLLLIAVERSTND